MAASGINRGKSGHGEANVAKGRNKDALGACNICIYMMQVFKKRATISRQGQARGGNGKGGKGIRVPIMYLQVFKGRRASRMQGEQGRNGPVNASLDRSVAISWFRRCRNLITYRLSKQSSQGPCKQVGSPSKPI